MWLSWAFQLRDSCNVTIKCWLAVAADMLGFSQGKIHFQTPCVGCLQALAPHCTWGPVWPPTWEVQVDFLALDAIL